MPSEIKVLSAKGGFLKETYRKSGLGGCARKIWAAIKMSAPIFLLRRRTNKSVGAYFDLITDDGRIFYGDDFHFGYFKNEDDDFKTALENHTDIVAEMAKVKTARRILDIGCGICAPAIRIANQYGDCHITGINISAEQIRQGRKLVKEKGLDNRIDAKLGNALSLDFEDSSFDSILCVEVAGDNCVNDAQKTRLISELYRVLKPGGYLGFSDLVLMDKPTREEERAMRTILYHCGHELMTDWPSLFERHGFKIKCRMDIIDETMKTWNQSISVYETRSEEVERRYGKRIARQTMDQLRRIPEILEKHGSFVILSLQKPI